MPVARQDLLRSVYRRYYTFAGKYFPKLVGARDMTKDVLDEWYTYFHQCSQCRRCSVFCPYGIDTAEISMAARDIMDSVGMGQKYSNEIIGKLHKIGNNLGLPEPALRNTLEGLEEDVKDDTGVDVKFPLDVKGAEVLVITPSADFFAEPHIDGLIGYAKVFHAAGISWTLSSYASEAANFSMFIGSHDNLHKVALRIREAALDLGVKRIVVGECGHAWRVAYSFWNTLDRAVRFPRPALPGAAAHLRVHLRPDPARRAHVRQVRERRQGRHLPRFLQRRARLAHGQHAGRAVRHSARRHQGRASTSSSTWRPDTIHESTFCCGGGGGLLTDDLMELRVKGAHAAHAGTKQVVDEHGVNPLAAICAICKASSPRYCRITSTRWT